MSGRKDWHSQHFLFRKDVARRLLDTASISRGDFVVEIGSGTGRLTEALVERGVRVVAYEIDPALVRRLRARLGHATGVLVRQAGFLREELPGHSYKVVSNVPFDLTSEIVRRLLAARPPPTEAVLIVQREAALRYAGHPCGRETLVLLLLKPWWRVRVGRWGSRFCFPATTTCRGRRSSPGAVRIRPRAALVGATLSGLRDIRLCLAGAYGSGQFVSNLHPHPDASTEVRAASPAGRPAFRGPLVDWLDMFERFARLAHVGGRHIVLDAHRRLTRRNLKRRRAARPRRRF